MITSSSNSSIQSRAPSSSNTTDRKAGNVDGNGIFSYSWRYSRFVSSFDILPILKSTHRSIIFPVSSRRRPLRRSSWTTSPFESAIVTSSLSVCPTATRAPLAEPTKKRRNKFGNPMKLYSFPRLRRQHRHTLISLHSHRPAKRQSALVNQQHLCHRVQPSPLPLLSHCTFSRSRSNNQGTRLKPSNRNYDLSLERGRQGYRPDQLARVLKDRNSLVAAVKRGQPSIGQDAQCTQSVELGRPAPDPPHRVTPIAVGTEKRDFSTPATGYNHETVGNHQSIYHTVKYKCLSIRATHLQRRFRSDPQAMCIFPDTRSDTFHDCNPRTIANNKRLVAVIQPATLGATDDQESTDCSCHQLGYSGLAKRSSNH